MSEPTYEFRNKYTAIGRKEGRAIERREMISRLEDLAAEKDLELGLQSLIIELKGEAAEADGDAHAAAGAQRNHGSASARRRDYGDLMADAMGLPPAPDLPPARAAASHQTPRATPAPAPKVAKRDYGDLMADAMGLPPDPGMKRR